jgi:hypothetical protein
MKTLFLGICILGLAVGVGNVGSPEFSGLARAVGAVFFVLFFIAGMSKIFGKEEAAINLNPLPLYERSMESSGSFNALLTNHTKAIL